jgi:hypothetical protein
VSTLLFFQEPNPKYSDRLKTESVRECVLFIGTRFSNLYTAVTDLRKRVSNHFLGSAREIRVLNVLSPSPRRGQAVQAT